MIIDVCLVLLTASVIYTLFFFTKFLQAKTKESEAITESYSVVKEEKQEQHSNIAILEQIQDVDSDIVVKAIRDPGIAAQFAWLEQEENIYG
jgi:hypothetical protein